MIRVEVIYMGQVQGVGFRMTTHQIARGFDVTGFVRNLADGSVEMVVEGEASEIQRFRDALQERMHDYIRDMRERQGASQGTYRNFSIQY